MSLSEYFEQHEEQAFVGKALATAVGITLIKYYFPGLVSFLFFILPLVFFIGIRLHAAASGVDATELLREHITFLPMIRSEEERRAEVKPWVTYGIILANVLIFYFFETSASDEMMGDLVFLPHKPDIFNVPLSAFTSIFLHASNGHLWGNMTFLWVVGSAVERRVGRLKFFWLYLVTGLIGGLVFILVEFLFHGRAGHALGASGAIAGIMGIFAIRCYFKSMIFPIPILGIFSLILPISIKVRLNSLLIMALFFLTDLSGGIQQITDESQSMIGHWAHLGGMISGMLIAGYLKLGDAAVEERHLEIGIKASQASMGYEGGARSMQIALDRNPNNVDALLGMARLKTKFTNSPEGKELYEKTLGLMLTERPAEVAGIFREYMGKFFKVPSDLQLVSRLAESMRKAGETDLQISCLERLVESPETAPQLREKAHYQLATLLEFTSCFEAARSSFARFAFEYPESLLAQTARERAGGEVYVPPRTAIETKATAAQHCPTCGAVMAVRTPTSGPKQGIPFWVCGGYPACRTFHPVAGPSESPEPPRLAPPAAPRYRLVFDGTIGFTSDPEETKENLVRLFGCGRDQVERLCSGNPTVLKKGLDHASALKYKDAISRTGALCTIEKEEIQPAPLAPQPVQEQSLRPRTEAAAAAPARTASFSCPKCGRPQEKGESCIACGVYFAKVAQLAEREFHDFQNHLEPSPQEGIMASLVEKLYLRRKAAIIALTSLLVISCAGYFLISCASDVINHSSERAKLANSDLKTHFELGKPELADIRRLLSAHDFKTIETLYDGYLNQYRKDVRYEGFIHEAYNLFSPQNGIAVEDLDLWVEKTGSYMAYAARGKYRAQQGFLARGDKYISDTPRANLEEMQRLHEEAAKDLQIAVAASPNLMPAYSSLLAMAKASNMPFSTKQILDEAEANDKRTFQVRHEYMVSLLPRWGGSYGEMSAFAKKAIEHTDLNPRLWSLQGTADADRADDYYRAGDYSAAIKSYTKALKFGDRVTWLKYRAACYYYQGKKDEAIADYRRVLYYDPTDSTAQAGARGEAP